MKLPWQQVRAIASKGLHRTKVMAVRRIPKAIGRTIRPNKTFNKINSLMDSAYDIAQRKYVPTTKTPQTVSEFLRVSQRPPAARSVKNLAKLGTIHKKFVRRQDNIKTTAAITTGAAVYGGLIATSVALNKTTKSRKRKVRRTTK